MHTLKTAQPCPQLRPFVRTYAQRNTDAGDPVVREPVPAQLEQILAFELGEPVDIWHADGRHQVSGTAAVCGAQSRFAAYMGLRGGVESFGIFFQPSGFSHLFAIPMNELTDRAEEASSVVGKTIRDLWNRLGDAANFEDRVCITECFLLQCLSRRCLRYRAAGVANYVLEQHGAVRMTDLASRTGLGLRQFQRIFLREVGVSPKAFARIARFQAALDAKVACPRRTWLDIAHGFGYHDQMHMIHDFESLGRYAPTQLLARLGDSRPPAMVTDEEKNNECRIFTMH
jgi:AraC-like DNA-binding protein